MGRRVSSGMMALGWLLLIPAIMLTMFLSVAQNAALYGRLQDRYVDEAVTGISDADRYRLNEGLADYLRGKRTELDMTAVVYGEERTAFGESERLHMVDVLGLFDLARGVRLWTAVSGALLLTAGVLSERGERRKRLLHTYDGVLIAWIVLILLFAAWARQDFNRAFIAFHHLFFNNGLWLMNPATDLMIRMLPEEFFRDMAVFSLEAMLLPLCVTEIALRVLRKIGLRSKK